MQNFQMTLIGGQRLLFVLKCFVQVPYHKHNQYYLLWTLFNECPTNLHQSLTSFLLTLLGIEIVFA